MKVAHSPEPAEERVVFRDGLGVRERREVPGGEVVEWFHLVADFSAAEALLRERVARLSKFQHVKFSRILGLEPSGKGRGPVLVSSHLPGTRLAEVLEMAGHGLVTFDAGAGLHVTREVLAGLAVLHDSRTVSHGTLAPERVVLTPNGRVVMVEHVLGPAIDRLQRQRHQLWREWRIPTPATPGQVKLDIQADLAQAGLLAIAALLGRPVDPEEYPHRLRGLLPAIQDRLARSPAAGIAGDVVAWVERLAPLDSRRAFTSAREAQQAYESLVAGHATALGITSARVKGVVAAIAALAPVPAPAPTHEAQSAVESAAVVGGASKPAASSTPPVVTSASDDEIDIEALLRLEAELEGGSAPGPDRVARAVEEAARVEVAGPSFEALEQERRVLHEQFASLVNAVAPAADEGPAHLIPETPPTSEPLVDERVRWSSMPAGDLSDVPVVHDAPASMPLEPVAVAPVEEITEYAALAPVDDDPVAIGVESREPGPSTMVDDADRTVVEDVAFVVEPIVVIRPEEPAPAAAIESVPADWWKEALPWRDEDEPAASSLAPADASSPSQDAIEAAIEEVTGANADVDVDAPQVPEPVATPEEPAAVAENFGYLTLESIEARASSIDAGPDASVFVEEHEAQDAEPAIEEAPAAGPTVLPDEDGVEDAPTLIVDPSAPFAFMGEEPATLEFSAEVLHDEPLDATATGTLEAAAPSVDVTPDAMATVVEEPLAVSPAPDVAPAPEPLQEPPTSGLFGDLRPIMLQELESASEERDDAPPLLADAAPLQAATSLFRHVEAAPQAPDWRRALLGADEHAPAPAASVFAEPEDTWRPDPVAEAGHTGDAGTAVAADASPEIRALDPTSVTMAMPEAVLVDVPPTGAAASVDEPVPVSATPDAQVPELVLVDEGTDGHVLDHLPSEAEASDLATTGVDGLDEGGEGEHEAHAVSSDDAAGVSAGRKKRRRPRRKKSAAAAPVPSVVESPAVEVIAAPDAPVAPAPASAPAADRVVVTPMVMAPVPPPEERDEAAEKAALHAVVAARPGSLLEREVPQWTPPTDLGALRPRVVQPTAREIAPQPSEPTPVEPERAPRAGGDEWGTGSFPAAAMASGEVVLPSAPAAPSVARPVVQAPAPAPVLAPAPVAPSHDVVGASEGYRPFDQEIRAVGLPDLVDDPRNARASITTAADAIGEMAPPSGRHPSPDPRVASLPEPAPRGVNWRRLMVAAALIVVFNGMGFAAWWWVQPGAHGTLVVETGRSGVEVLVDGTSMGRTPFRGEVKPGRHTLRLRQGSIVRDMPVEISDGVVTTQTVDWLPDGAGRGALQVTSNPSGAELFVNGKARGKTPVLLEDLLEGDQQLLIRSEAGTVTQTATVVAGETTPIEIKVFAGWVQVDSEYEVDLSLNGKKIGASMDGQILLPPGPYKLRAENRSFGIDQPITFTVEPGAVTRFSLKVAPAWYDAPEGTEVIVDGASAGTGPGRVSIAPGTHDVVVRAADGSEKHFSGIVKANRAFEP